MNQATVGLIVAFVGLCGVLAASFIGQLSAHNHQGREVLYEPARAFAREALGGLAAMLTITPPKSSEKDTIHHRNEDLIHDVALREKRFGRCEAALNRMRVARADVRLVFLPNSLAAEYSRRVLEAQRLAYDTAWRYYVEFDGVEPDARAEWRATRGLELRELYKSWRMMAYFNLDRFFDEVAVRVKRPTWNRKRIEQATDLTAPAKIKARLVDAKGGFSSETVQAESYWAALAQLDAAAKSSGRTVAYLEG